LHNSIYRQFVLEPSIDPQRDGQLNWRQSMWEHFYPRIRKQTDAASAAEIIVEYLRKQITFVSDAPLTIDEMWKKKEADAKGFDALQVAAFRSVGIPSRLNGEGQTEIFEGGDWLLISSRN